MFFMPAARLRRPPVTPFPARAAFIMRVVQRHGDFVNEACPEAFDGADGRLIIRVAGDDDRLIERPDKGRDCPACVQRKTVPAKPLLDLVADVPGAYVDVFGVADAEADLADVH